MSLGRIHSVESFATLEGPGIRYAIFLQGCPLRCAYCHNPETQKTDGAAWTVTADALAATILRYRPYFRNGGGATFSGGEPLLQAAFLNDVLPLLQEAGIHTALDTSGYLLNAEIKEVYRKTDLVILDLKFYSGADYRDICGADILETVRKTFVFLQEIRKPVLVRTVIVPGVNDTEAAISAYAAFLAPFANITSWELKPFHTLGFQKYAALGWENPYIQKEALPEETLDALKSWKEKIWRT